MFSPTVQLRSGGYIVINQTEALVSIDVNSGRSTREHHIEDTALKTNCEAAEEVARQLRLRDLAGLIVIDFIDMDEKRNNRTVERRLKDALRNDRARIQVGRISHFGLMEMSRQRIRTSVLESSTEKCPHCGGTGHVRSVSSVALQLLRSIEETLLKGPTHNLIVRTRPEIALYVLNHKRAHLRGLEERFRVTLTVNADEEVGGQIGFTIDRGEQVMTIEQAKAVLAQQADLTAPALIEEEEPDSSRRARGRDRSRDRVRSRCRRARRRRSVRARSARRAKASSPRTAKAAARTASRAKAAAGAAGAAAGAAVAAAAAKAARARISSPATNKAHHEPVGEFAARSSGRRPAAGRSDRPMRGPRAANRCPRACRRRNARAKASASAKARTRAAMRNGDGRARRRRGRRGGRRNRRDREGHEGGPDIAAASRPRNGHEAQPDTGGFAGNFAPGPEIHSRPDYSERPDWSPPREAQTPEPAQPAYAPPQYEAAPQSMAAALPRSPRPNRPRRRAAARRCASPRPTFSAARRW